MAYMCLVAEWCASMQLEQMDLRMLLDIAVILINNIRELYGNSKPNINSDFITPIKI